MKPDGIRRTHLLHLLAIVLLGCGGGGGGGGADGGGGGGAALVGTWATATCLPPEASSCDYAITFAADGSYSNASTYVKDPATTSGFAGCTITSIATGYVWTATDTTVTIEAGPSPQMVVTRSGCADPGDDQPTPTMPPDFSPASFTLPATSYTVSGAMLTLGGGGGLTFTRR